MACHIAAAASGPGARRFVPTMTKAERTDYHNGIWMCRTHGDLIDRDEVRFTIPLLKQWRVLAEKRAEIAQALGRFDPARFDLFRHEVEIARENLNETTIGEAFIDAGVPLFWRTAVAGAVRDYVFEIAQNALTHGGASAVRLLITPKTIQMFDDGAAFDPRTLPNLPKHRGGGMAVRALRGTLGDRLIISAHPRDGQNHYTVQYLRLQSDIVSETPCHLDFENDMSRRGVVEQHHLEKVAHCETIYILLPDFMSYSKAVDYGSNLAESFAGRQVLFVGQEVSQGVRDLLNLVPGSRFVSLVVGE